MSDKSGKAPMNNQWGMKEVSKIEFKEDNKRMIVEAHDDVIYFGVSINPGGILAKAITYDEARELKKWIELQLFSRKLPL